MRVARASAWLALIVSCASVGDVAPGHVDAGARDARVEDAPGEDAGVAAAGLWLEDVTEAAGVDFERPLPNGYDDLVARLGGGVCVLDVDGVPPLDLFFPMRSGGSRLFVGRSVLSYADETEPRGLASAGDALGCLAFDADGDADTDLIVTGVGTIALYANEGGVFAESAALEAETAPGSVYTSSAAGDVDGDGDVNLVVAGFVDASAIPIGDCDGIPCAVLVAELAYLPNRVFLHDGAGYVELAVAGPLSVPEPTLVVGISDVDGDGREEVYVGNDAGDFVRDRVVRFEAPGFVDVSDTVGMAYDAAGNGIDTMGWTAGDIDGDTRIDYAVTAFEGSHSPIFVCGADGFCEDRGRALGTIAVAGSFRWADALVDLDLDGDVDLVEVAGHVFTVDEGAHRGFAIAHEQPMNLLTNRGDGRLSLARPAPRDALADARAGRGLAVADLDEDGRPDLVVTTSRGRPAVLRNVHAAEGRFLRVILEGRSPATDAIGARVTVLTPARRYVRERVAGEGLLGSFDPRLFFGIPAAGPVDVEVRWPSGVVQRVSSVALDGDLVLHEP